MKETAAWAQEKVSAGWEPPLILSFCCPCTLQGTCLICLCVHVPMCDVSVCAVFLHVPVFLSMCTHVGG